MVLRTRKQFEKDLKRIEPSLLSRREAKNITEIKCNKLKSNLNYFTIRISSYRLVFSEESENGLDYLELLRFVKREDIYDKLF